MRKPWFYLSTNMSKLRSRRKSYEHTHARVHKIHKTTHIPVDCVFSRSFTGRKKKAKENKFPETVKRFHRVIRRLITYYNGF